VTTFFLTNIYIVKDMTLTCGESRMVMVDRRRGRRG